jgi:hypothetical protein
MINFINIFCGTIIGIYGVYEIFKGNRAIIITIINMVLIVVKYIFYIFLFINFAYIIINIFYYYKYCFKGYKKLVKNAIKNHPNFVKIKRKNEKIAVYIDKGKIYIICGNARQEAYVIQNEGKELFAKINNIFSFYPPINKRINKKFREDIHFK